jgi:hypothetical protein
VGSGWKLLLGIEGWLFTLAGVWTITHRNSSVARFSRRGSFGLSPAASLVWAVVFTLIGVNLVVVSAFL